MDDSKDVQNGMDQSKEIQSNHRSANNFIVFLFFLLIINQTQRKNPIFPREGYLDQEDYMVTMGEKTPVFPLDENTPLTQTKSSGPTLLKAKDSHEFYSMLNKLKPYMHPSNRRILSIYEKWQTLLHDVNELSTQREEGMGDAKTSSGDLLHFLWDIKPFVHEDYHPQIQAFAQGIQGFLDIQRNILHLQNTLDNFNKVKDQVQRMNNLVDALQPFMGDGQRKTLEQFKNVSQVMEMMKIANQLSDKEKASPGKKGSDSSQLMELLDLLDSSSPTKEEKGKEDRGNIEAAGMIQAEEEVLSGMEHPQDRIVLEKDEEPEEFQYEEIFQEEDSIMDTEEILHEDFTENKGGVQEPMEQEGEEQSEGRI